VWEHSAVQELCSCEVHLLDSFHLFPFHLWKKKNGQIAFFNKTVRLGWSIFHANYLNFFFLVPVVELFSSVTQVFFICIFRKGFNCCEIWWWYCLRKVHFKTTYFKCWKIFFLRKDPKTSTTHCLNPQKGIYQWNQCYIHHKHKISGWESCKGFC